MKHLVIDFQPINMRLCKLRIRGRFRNYSLFSIHAPTEDKGMDEKEAFYDVLEREYRKCPRQDIKILLGDFNAQVGQEQYLRPTIGKNSLHKESNDNGIRLVDFATSNGLVVGSTMFPHKNIHKGSWTSPDGKTVNQIDHVLIDVHHKSDLEDVRTYRGANMDSDHFLIIAKLQSRINSHYRHQQRNKMKRYNVEKLKDPEIVNQYIAALNNCVTGGETNTSNWMDCRQVR